MQTLILALFISLFSVVGFASNKTKKQMQVQPVILAVSFEAYDKNKQLLNTFSFDGEQKTQIVADVKNTGNFKCEGSGHFEIVPLNGQKYIASFFNFACGENDQKTKSKIGRLLIPVKDYQNFSKIIYLHKNQPEVLLKIKELSL